MANIPNDIPQHKFSRGDIAFRDHKPQAKIYGILEAETIGGNTAWAYVMQYIWPDKEEEVFDDGWVAGACFHVEQIAHTLFWSWLAMSLTAGLVGYFFAPFITRSAEEAMEKLAADAEAAIHAAATQAKMMDGARND